MSDSTDANWLPIPGFEHNYLVSDYGDVYSQRLGRVLKRSRRGKYPGVALCKDGKIHKVYLHQLVAAVFIGPRPAGMQVRHLNDDREDARASNLAYGTQSDNMLDAVANGVHPTASKTRCKNGHEFTEANTYRGLYAASDGTMRPRRQCRACTNQQQLDYKERKRRAS